MTIPTLHEELAAKSVSADEDLGRPVRVRWLDSGLALYGWQQKGDLPDNVSEVESVGLWMGENENVVMVGGTRDAENQNWLNVQLIWKPCLVAKEWLS